MRSETTALKLSGKRASAALHNQIRPHSCKRNMNSLVYARFRFAKE